ncbi:MAG: class B sortase, partial [Lachnospiraceae bacterium]|nr:class B sortase [Lachnospiraceae bacterium]
MGKRKRNNKGVRSTIRLICGLMAVISLSYFAYYVYMSEDSTDKSRELSGLKDKEPVFSAKQQIHLTPEEKAPDMLEKFQTLYLKNKSIVGWINIEGTVIDYPVMQSENPDYYLDHNFEQEKDNNGSVFMDPACSIWPRSQNLIIYGHNMKSGKMFGTLDSYKNKNFFKEHPVIKFDTLYESGEYKVMYVFNEVVHEETEVTFKYYQFVDADSSMEFRSNMKEMAKMSLYETGVEAYYGDRLITLSTCDYSEGAQRFVVV